MRRFQVYAPGPNNLPLWARTGFWNPVNKTLYLPAALAGNEASVAEKAGEDMVGTHSFDGHIFVPSVWLSRSYPAAAKLVEVFTKQWESEPAEVEPTPSEADEWLASIEEATRGQ